MQRVRSSVGLLTLRGKAELVMNESLVEAVTAGRSRHLEVAFRLSAAMQESERWSHLGREKPPSASTLLQYHLCLLLRA